MVTLEIHVDDDAPIEYVITDRQFADLERLIGQRYAGEWDRWMKAMIESTLAETRRRQRRGPARPR